MKMCTLILLLPLALIAQPMDGDRAIHLKGINYIYMNVDTSLSSEISTSERMDISDIVELQLRRANIILRPYVVNAPRGNVPLLELTIKDLQARGGDSHELILRVHDYVTIDRNKERTIATIFEMSRTTTPASGDTASLKAKLRELMGDFVDAFKKQNP
ncbi:MAG: hypothetical protein ACPGSB_09240 [Opitutales bacterium]